MKTVAMNNLIYENPLACQEDLDGFVCEGEGAISFPMGRMRLEGKLSPDLGQKSNFVLWCPVDFPSDVRIEWEFTPLREPGLCVMFFGALGKNGEDILTGGLAKRTGEYDFYHHGDLNAYHLSYFRRRYPEERAFHTCNLRKSYGFHLVAQGADPIPDVADADKSYALCIIRSGSRISFFVNDLQVLEYEDDGTLGNAITGGKLGFRQMAPLIAEYKNLKVYTV
ncbi:MAG: DUF1961 family protein [Oscillospiraceae bacterium]